MDAKRVLPVNIPTAVPVKQLSPFVNRVLLVHTVTVEPHKLVAARVNLAQKASTAMPEWNRPATYASRVLPARTLAPPHLLLRTNARNAVLDAFLLLVADKRHLPLPVTVNARRGNGPTYWDLLPMISVRARGFFFLSYLLPAR